METNSKDDCLFIKEVISEEKFKDFERQYILEKVAELKKYNQNKSKEIKRKNIISNINEIEFIPSIFNESEESISSILNISEISNASDISTISNFSNQNIYKISSNSFSFINNNNKENKNKKNEIKNEKDLCNTKQENNNINKKTLLNKIEENIINFFRTNFECKNHPNNKYIAYCDICEKNICQMCLLEELEHISHIKNKKISYFKDLMPSEIQIKYYKTLFIFSKYNLKRIREIIIEICYELSELYEKETLLDNKIKIKALQKSLKKSYKSFYIKNLYQLIYIQNIITLFSDCKDLKYLNYQVINNLHKIKMNSVKIPDLYKENVIKKTKIMIEFMVNKNNILKSSDSNYSLTNYKNENKIELKKAIGNDNNNLFYNDEKSMIYNNFTSIFKKDEAIIDKENLIFQNEENALSEIISNLSENIKNKINQKKYNYNKINLNNTNKIFETENSNAIYLSKKKDIKQNINNIKIKASIENEDILENISTIFDFDIKKQIYKNLPIPCSDEVEFKKNVQYVYYDKVLKKDITCIYHGEFLKNTLIRHGRGLFIWEDKGYYLGYWKNDKREGKGRNNYSNGNVYQGTYKNGKKEGNGMYKWKNGDIYVGEFKNDLKDGAGKYKFRNGDKYIGSFKMDKIDGNGTYYWANKNSFSGQFKNDKIEGKGILKYFCSNTNNIILYTINYQNSENEDELVNNKSLKENQFIESFDGNQNINKSNSENKKIKKK